MHAHLFWVNLCKFQQYLHISSGFAFHLIGTEFGLLQRTRVVVVVGQPVYPVVHRCSCHGYGNMFYVKALLLVTYTATQFDSNPASDALSHTPGGHGADAWSCSGVRTGWTERHTTTAEQLPDHSLLTPWPLDMYIKMERRQSTFIGKEI